MNRYDIAVSWACLEGGRYTKYERHRDSDIYIATIIKAMLKKLKQGGAEVGHQTSPSIFGFQS
jgi:hypothetical protein